MEDLNGDSVAEEQLENVAEAKRAKRGGTRTGGRRWHEHYDKRLGGGEVYLPRPDGTDAATGMARDLYMQAVVDLAHDAIDELEGLPPLFSAVLNEASGVRRESFVWVLDLYRHYLSGEELGHPIVVAEGDAMMPFFEAYSAWAKKHNLAEEWFADDAFYELYQAHRGYFSTEFGHPYWEECLRCWT